jgi:hypothetical protein
MHCPPIQPIALAVTLVLAGCAAARPLERTPPPVRAASPRAAVPVESSATLAPRRCSTPVAVVSDEQEEERSLFEVILFGPTDDTSSMYGARRADPLKDHRPWWETVPSESERARRAGQFRAETGWFVHPTFSYTQHATTDLDGQKFLAGPDTIVLPELDPGVGLGFALGYRYSEGAFTVNYVRTKNDGTWLGGPFDATFESISLDFTQYYLRSSHVQPFLTLGVATTSLDIENGAFMGANTADAELEDDLVINFGGGIAFYLSPRLALNFGAVYRFLHEYTEATGVAPKGPTSPIDGAGVTATVGISYTF